MTSGTAGISIWVEELPQYSKRRPQDYSQNAGASSSSISPKFLASVHVDSSSLSCFLGRANQCHLPRYSSSKYRISNRCLSSTITIMRMSISLKTGRVRTTWNSQYCSLDTLNGYAQPLHNGICWMVFRYVHEKCHMRNGTSSYAPVQSKSYVRLRSGQEQRKTINLRCRFQASVSSVYDIATQCRCV
jgi:hypothetical protein